MLVTIKNILIIILLGTIPVCSVGQNIDTDSLCETFNQQLSISSNKSDSLKVYLVVVNKTIYNLDQTKKDSLQNVLNETCPNIKIVSNYHRPLTFNKSQNSTESFKKQKASVKWKKHQLKDAIKICQGHDLNKTICKDAVKEASKHINYQDFISLTDYQKGVVLAKAYDILKK